jgi:hypothetical protein
MARRDLRDYVSTAVVIVAVALGILASIFLLKLT